MTMLLVSRAPLERLQAYRERMGWGIDWASTGGSDFNRDLGFTHTEEELRPFLEGEIPPAVKQMAEAPARTSPATSRRGPGLSAYALADGRSTGPTSPPRAGLEPAMAYYGLLDRTPGVATRSGERELAPPPRRVLIEAASRTGPLRAAAGPV